MKKYLEDALVFGMFILVISCAMYFADRSWHTFPSILITNTIVFGLVMALDLGIKSHNKKNKR